MWIWFLNPPYLLFDRLAILVLVPYYMVEAGVMYETWITFWCQIAIHNPILPINSLVWILSLTFLLCVSEDRIT